MTNEKAIQIIKNMIHDDIAVYGNKPKLRNEALALAIKALEEIKQGECRTCRHRDPEDKKCDCGGKERQGCPFPVSDDYYCKYYEKGCGAE